jgi:hypothetical protein
MGLTSQERILNHAPRTVAGKHYNHAKYLGPMRQALEAWSSKLRIIVNDATAGSIGCAGADNGVFS